MVHMRRRAIALAASAFALSVLLALSSLPLGAASALAGDAVDTGQFDAILEMDQNPPAGFNADTDENPYGHAKDQPFLMNVESELMMYSVSEGTILDPEPEVHANWYDGGRARAETLA